MARMTELDDEKRQLKRMYAEMSMQIDLLKGALEKRGKAASAQGDGRMSGSAPIRQYCFGLPSGHYQRDQLRVSAEAQ